MLAVSTLRAGLHEQDSRIIDSYFLIMFSVSSYFHSEAEMNLNKYVVYAILASKAKCIIILILKYNVKLLIKEYKQL